MYNLTEGFNLKKFESGFCKTTRRAKQMSEFESFLADRLAEKKELYIQFKQLQSK
jgi:hypothetical protein